MALGWLMGSERAEVVIIGGGIAGLSTACHLAQAGQSGVVLLDREDLPGFYSSGHNAGIGRQLTGRPEHTDLAIKGRNRLADLGLIDAQGGVLLGAEPGGTKALAAEAAAFHLSVIQELGSPLPGLRAAEHLRVPSDGNIDVDRLLAWCAEGARVAGASLRYGCEVCSVDPFEDGFVVETDQGTLQARWLVNAAGAWAQSVGRMAGGLDIPFLPLRRHLIWSAAPHPKEDPWTWWVDRPLYLRPESGGLLMCAVEEESVSLPPRGQQPACDDAVLERLFEGLRELAPSYAELPITRLWCGFRTFAPDRLFTLGWDPVNPNLFWVAGLGGHGMTSGLAVGSAVTEMFFNHKGSGNLGPARFLS